MNQKHASLFGLGALLTAGRSVANRALRSQYSPLEAYYTSMARKGLDAGYSGNPQTLNPRLGATLLHGAGPALGHLDHLVGHQIGHELRKGVDKVSDKYPFLQPHIQQHATTLPGLINTVRAVGASGLANISKNKARRIRRLLADHIENPVAKSVLNSTNPALDRAPALAVQHLTNATSPLVRHLANAVIKPPESPLADRVEKAFVHPGWPAQQGRTLLAAQSALGAAGGVLTGDPGAAIRGALTSAAQTLPEAAMVGGAERGHMGGLTRVKGRIVNSMANPKPGVMPALERAAWNVYGAIDPTSSEFVRAGKDIHNYHKALTTMAAKKSPQAAQEVQQVRTDALNPLAHETSLASTARGFKDDITSAAQGVADHARRLQGKLVFPQALKPAPRAGLLPSTLGPEAADRFAAFMGGSTKTAAQHHAPVVKVEKREGPEAWICPHCNQEIQEKSLYRDAKGWWFHRPCFAKGKGSIKLPEKRANALVGGAVGGALGLTAGPVLGAAALPVAAAGATLGAGAGWLKDFMYPKINHDELKTIEQQPRERQTELRRKMRTIANALNGRGAWANTYHKRVVIPKNYLKDNDLVDTGYLPSLVAVPEHGQDKWTTFRHPFDLTHFHSHGANWIAHKDDYPSIAMLRYQNVTPVERLKRLTGGIRHATIEGVPGWALYARNAIQRKLLGTGNEMQENVLQEQPRAVAGQAYADDDLKRILRRAKTAADGALGSGADAGQATIPPRIMDAAGVTPAGPENQPASDDKDLVNYDQPLDTNVFDMDAVKAAVMGSLEMMSDGTADTQQATDIDGVEWTNTHGGKGNPILALAQMGSGAAGAGGKVYQGTGIGFAPGYGDTPSTGFGAGAVGNPAHALDEPTSVEETTNVLDSDTLSTGPLPHLSA